MRNTDLLFKSLFKRNFRSVDTKAFLTALTKEHPYFTAAQFYLLKQTETTGQDFTIQAAKTSLLFNNPFWLNFQLNQLDTIIAETEEIIEKNENNFVGRREELEILQPSADASKIAPDEIIIAEPLHQTESADSKNEIDPIVVQEQSSSVFTPGIAINETADEEDDYDNEEEEDNGKNIQPLNIKLNFDAAATTKDDAISYQPLYTSDYFASLGIKLNENGVPVDKLGKQLKSFTDWLKIMKKIHPDQLPLQSGQSDIEIQQMAEKSNTKGDILTEAMADVLVQQGKITKAIEVYQKLSLLNPSKSAYFTAKIDNIEK